MPTPNLNLASVQEKIKEAKKYSNIIKDNAQSFNGNVGKLINLFFRDIQEAVRFGDDIDKILDSLIAQIREYLAHTIELSITAACEREREDKDTYLFLLPVEVTQCSTAYYEDTLTKYRDILKSEIEFAIESGYTEDMSIFLHNPQGYMAGKKNGLLSLKENIKEVSNGVSYSFSDNMRKLGISVAALSYTNTEMYIWKTKESIAGYFGTRNSNYPCALCDQYAHIFIPISQGMIYPLHNRCVCSVVPLSQSELL